MFLGTFRVGKEGGGKGRCKKWFGAGVRVEGKGRDVMNYYQTPSLPPFDFFSTKQPFLPFASSP